MQQGIQKILKALGDGGCLLLCYAEITRAFDERNLINDYYILIEKNIIDKDCYVLDAEKLFRHYGLYKIIIRDIEPEKNEVYIAKWVNGNFTHFVVMKNNKIIFDPLGESNTVKNGKLVEKRVIR